MGLLRCRCGFTFRSLALAAIICSLYYRIYPEQLCRGVNCVLCMYTSAGSAGPPRTSTPTCGEDSSPAGEKVSVNLRAQ